MLAEKFQVSRTPVRSAIARILSGGFLVAGEKRGAKVAPWRDEDTAEVFALRVMRGGYGASHASENATPDDIALFEKPFAC